MIEVVEVPVRRKKSMTRRATPVKRRSGGLTKLKKELDRVFSLYIRAKYPKKCFTCGKEGVLQNGHFVVRKYLSTRWDENNCRPQCIGCNLYGKGMTADFEERLSREIGAEKVQALKDKRKELWKLDRAWYEEKITFYQEKLQHGETGAAKREANKKKQKTGENSENELKQ